ncbi:hypothetical protein Q4574_21225 [Aliiglaciecola sp. 3_MG-2023]|uniref:hypothetical protein n=1 Tax=Aliiglaciecola sp. 3_MG-2023 TaxID=3062644 RepID=UPI0026E27C8A|nr:hypothetical protein [Aliiglaciecola sp. 3_MG-2023]MDO6695832.1 hypothetical protein [Aliiglaciecola sp. 3_MG-2023]
MKIFYLLILFSFSSIATTCITNEKTFEQWNNKYSARIIVEAKQSVAGFDVLVWFPTTIEKMPLNFVVFHLGDKEQPIFSSQLAIFEEDGQKAVYFTTSHKQNPSGYLVASYGSDCGIQVGKAVELATQT